MTNESILHVGTETGNQKITSYHQETILQVIKKKHCVRGKKLYNKIFSVPGLYS